MLLVAFLLAEIPRAVGGVNCCACVWHVQVTSMQLGVATAVACAGEHATNLAPYILCVAALLGIRRDLDKERASLMHWVCNT